jgi:hypothetical protein
MADLSGNSCNIITILPLGIDCDIINASTPDASNGYMTILITGGTPPYNVTWSNGAQGTFLNNLSPGDYSATVVDYYGDFSATTTCTVGYDSFYLQEFESCSNAGTYVYYMATTPSLYTPNKIYKLTTQTGCWENIGTTLYTGQTYYNNVALTGAGPYNTCEICQATEPIVSPYNGPLCFSIFTIPSTYSQNTFYSGGTINNYPSWTSNTQTIYYNTGTTRWTVSNWATPNVPYLQNPSALPTGSWTYPGTVGSTVTVVTGTCSSPSLNLTVMTQNPSCSTNTGSATIGVTGGVPPYQYSLNNIIYGTSNVFINLTPGLRTVYVKDSASPQNTATQNFTITPLFNYVNYSLNLNFVEQNPLINTIQQTAPSTTYNKTSNWNLSLTPNTPFQSPGYVKFDITFDVSTTAYTNSLNVPQILNTITVTGTTGTTVPGPIQTSLVTQTVARPLCSGGNIITSTYQIRYLDCYINNTYGNLSGLINQNFTQICGTNPNCLLRAYSNVTMTVKKISISPLNCRNVDSTVISRTTMAQSFGPLCPTNIL